MSDRLERKKQNKGDVGNHWLWCAAVTYALVFWFFVKIDFLLIILSLLFAALSLEINLILTCFFIGGFLIKIIVS